MPAGIYQNTTIWLGQRDQRERGQGVCGAEEGVGAEREFGGRGLL